MSFLDSEAVAIEPVVPEGYIAVKTLPDGRTIGIQRLLYHWTLHVTSLAHPDLEASGYAERYCFQHFSGVVIAFAEWDGIGDPPGGWNKHIPSQRTRLPVRRRINGDPAKEYFDGDFARMQELEDAP